MEQSPRGPSRGGAAQPGAQKRLDPLKVSGVYDVPLAALEPPGGAPDLEGSAQPPEVPPVPSSEEQLAEASPAEQPPTEIEAAQQLIAQLGTAKAALGQPDEGALSQAKEALDAARPLVDSLSEAEDSAAAAVRTELLDAYFGLERSFEHRLESVTQQMQQRERRPSRKTKAPDVPRTERPLALEGRRRLRLFLLVAIGVAVVAGGGHLAWWLTRADPNEGEPLIEYLQERGTVIAQVRHAGKLTQALQSGIPIVTYVSLSRGGRGGLRATALAISAKGGTLKRTYTWYKNGAAIRTGDETGVMEAQALAPPGNYSVAATASDGQMISAPLATRELTL